MIITVSSCTILALRTINLLAFFFDPVLMGVANSLNLLAVPTESPMSSGIFLFSSAMLQIVSAGARMIWTSSSWLIVCSPAEKSC
jgi:hypothetical protein